MISKFPVVLLSNPDQTLEPKIQYLKQVGFSDTDICQFLTKCCNILHSSLEYTIIPCFQLLKTLLPREENVNDNFSDAVKEVLEIGFDPSSKMFVYAVRDVSSVCKAKREVKMGIFRSFGWSDEEIRLAIRQQPKCIAISEEKLRIGLDFFMNGKNWEAERLAKNSTVLPSYLVMFTLAGQRALAVLAGTLCCSGNSKLHNIPNVSDIRTMILVLESLGVEVDVYNGEVTVDTQAM
ncbi:hypothetical protein IFM89_037966 [Coptis chinensis]|uniref:Uncharacterized protein n=1 Tax=Coptis chinensis TaxID=261450 RepID=A0A835I8D9_9MAGN|nr:hypothetical protein IFM89_037966 [Coptis chinensis]